LKKIINLFLFLLVLLIVGCKEDSKTIKEETIPTTKKVEVLFDAIDETPVKTPEGMIWVTEKTFIQGAKETDRYAMPREKPSHNVKVDGFFINITEVTNNQFKAFVEATGYLTIAEQEIDWEDMKAQLPANTPKPHDSILQPGSLIFNKNVNAVVNMDNYGQWWTWEIGASWKHPQGPGSSIKGQDDYPVVHIAYDDALAYCKWANRRLPTEAEWESAAQGTNTDAIFTWGNDPQLLNKKANTWQGIFPTLNEPIDGFKYIAPVKSFEPNSIGLYDMSGNVWEITSDFFNTNYYKTLVSDVVIDNPKGATKTYTISNPYGIEHVIKGGSFLCNASYCASFRISAKMGTSADSGSDHSGFRTVATVDMLSEKQ
jgi:sulfatase modifying factor 1